MLNVSFFLFTWLQYLERTHQRFVYTHDCSRIIKLSTVIWRTKDCYKLSFCKKLIPLFNHLMCPADQVDVLFFQEVGYYVASEYKADSSLILAPSFETFFGVWPQQVAKQPLVRNFDWPDNLEDLVKAFKLRTEPTVHTKDLFID